MKKTLGPEPTQEIQKIDTTKSNKKNLNKNKDWSYYVIIVSLILILIPTIFFITTLYKAYSEGGNPVLGHRFDNDLDPRIEKEPLETVAEEMKKIDHIQRSHSNLTTATVRFYLEVEEGISTENYVTLSQKAEEVLHQHFDPKLYFTSNEDATKLQYDYEIYVYNLEEEKTLMLNKSSRMSQSYTQMLSEAKSQDMVDRLQKIQEEREHPDETTDENQGSQEVDE